MRKRAVRPPSAAMVVAVTALFISLGGTAVALTQIGTKQIKNGAVTKSKLHNAAVTTSKIHNGAVTPKKLAMQPFPDGGFQSFNDGPGALSPGLTRIASLSVPAGRYLANAKLWVLNNNAANRAEVKCQLTNDLTGDTDTTEVTVDGLGSTSYHGRAAITLEAASVFWGLGQWILSCESSAVSGIAFRDVKMQAMQVSSLQNLPTF